MNNKIHNIVLNLDKSVSDIMLEVMAGDTVNEIRATLMQNGKPYTVTSDCSAVFVAKISDDSVISGNCTISDSVIKYILTSLPSGVENGGIIKCNIIISESSDQFSTPMFGIRIHSNIQPSTQQT